MNISGIGKSYLPCLHHYRNQKSRNKSKFQCFHDVPEIASRKHGFRTGALSFGPSDRPYSLVNAEKIEQRLFEAVRKQRERRACNQQPKERNFVNCPKYFGQSY